MAEFLADDEAVVNAHKHTVYDLIVNICHDGQPSESLSLFHYCFVKWVWSCRER